MENQSSRLDYEGMTYDELMRLYEAIAQEQAIIRKQLREIESGTEPEEQ